MFSKSQSGHTRIALSAYVLCRGGVQKGQFVVVTQLMLVTPFTTSNRAGI